MYPVWVRAAFDFGHYVADIHGERDAVRHWLDESVQEHIHVPIRRLCETLHLIKYPVPSRTNSAIRVCLIRERMARAKGRESSDDIFDPLRIDFGEHRLKLRVWFLRLERLTNVRDRPDRYVKRSACTGNVHTSRLSCP